MKKRQVGNHRSEFRSRAVVGGIAVILATAGCAAVAGSFGERGGHREGKHSGDHRPGSERDTVTRFENFAELNPLLEKKAVAAVIVVTRDGPHRLFVPGYIQSVRPADFKLPATSIKEPTTFTVIPYTVNPDCWVVGQNGVWVNLC